MTMHTGIVRSGPVSIFRFRDNASETEYAENGVVTVKCPMNISKGWSLRAVVSLRTLWLSLTAVLIIITGCADQKKQAKSLVQTAVRHQDSGRHGEAIQNLNRAIALNPALAEAFYARGISHAALGRQNESLADLNTAVRLNPDWDAAWVALGVAHRSADDTTQALRAFTRALRVNASNVDARFDRACLHARLGNREKSISDLESLLQLRPDHDDALLMHARAVMADKPEVAAGSLGRLIARNKTCSEAWLLRGLCRAAVGDTDRAIADLNVACRMQSTDYRPWLERGRLLIKIGRAEDAVSDLTKAVQYGPHIAECHFEQGRALAAAGNADAAESSFDRALLLQDAFAPALIARAELAAGRGQHEKALADLRQVSATTGTSGTSSPGTDQLTERARIEEVRILMASGDHTSALSALERMVSGSPVSDDVLKLRAELYAETRRTESALRDYSELLERNPHDTDLRLRRSMLLGRSGDLTTAVHELSAILETNPNWVPALRVRAQIYDDTDQHALAVSDLTAALIQSPDDTDLLQRRSGILRETGERNAAIRDLSRLSELLPPDDPGRVTCVADLAELYRVTGKAEEAITLLDQLLLPEGSRPSAHLLLQKASLQLGLDRVSEAADTLSRLREDDAASRESLTLLGEVAARLGDDAAAVDLTGRIEPQHRTSEICCLRGRSLARLNRLDEAAEELSRALDRDSSNAEALLARAEVYEHAGDWKKALADARRLLARNPESVAGLRLRGISHFHLGHYQDAQEILDSPKLQAVDDPALRWIRAQCFVQLQQLLQARRELDNLITASPDHEDGRKLRAQIAEQQGEYDVAIEDLSFLIRHRNESTEYLLLRGLLMHRRGRYQDAAADYTRVLALQPDSVHAMHRRGLAKYQLQQFEAAVTDFETALSLNPRLVEARYLLGNISASVGSATDAMLHYQQALEIDPSHVATLYNMGNLLFNDGKIQEAVDSWTRAIEVQPGLFRAYNNRAAALVTLNRCEQAIADYEKALEISPGFARAWDNYAWLLATSDDPAIRDTTRAVFMARRACELTNFRDWNTLSTLASAYAEAGDMNRAAEWSVRAFDAAPDDQREELEKLVQIYQRQQANSADAANAVRSRSAVRQ